MKLTLPAALLAVAVSSADATSIKMDYLPIGHMRTDPIITQDCLSDHVHTFYGPATPETVRPEVTYEDLIATTPDQNTGNVEENKSLYWHPTVYSYDKATDTYTRDVMAHSSAYYVWANGIGTKAFPNGFRMIAGLNPDDPANFPNAVAECVNESPCEKEDCSTENTFFPSTACDELEVSMSMPTCWDGRLDSPDHVSHVHYTLDGEFDGECPESHPFRIPQIQLFFRMQPYDGGHHTFSDGSSVFHTDYVSGWDENFLQDVLDNCETDSFAANPNSFCEDHVTFRDAPKCTDEETCDFADPALMEKIRAIQPPAVDIESIVTPEETEFVVGDLPRGTCTGELLPKDGGGPSPTPAPVAPTPAPVAPTPAPVAPTPNPTPPPVDSCEDDSSWTRIKRKKNPNQQPQGCEWVGKKPNKIENRCKKNGRYEEGGPKVKAWDACPKTCGTCDSN